MDFPNGLTIFGGIGFDTTNNYGLFLDSAGVLHAKSGRVTQSTIQVDLTPEQIDTLNSAPIDVVFPANGTTFLLPQEVLFIGSQGSTPYSAPVAPLLGYSNLLFDFALDDGSWDGSTPKVFANAVPLKGILGGTVNDSVDVLASIGLALTVFTGADVTDGDAPCTIIVTYQAYDLTGLI